MNHIFKLVSNILLALSLCFLLFACSKISQKNFEKIETNMTMDQVVAILGEPTHSEDIQIAGLSGTSTVWKDSNGEIDIQFLNNRVLVKSYSKPIKESDND